MVCLDYDATVECSVCHETTPDGYSEIDGKIICEQCVDKKDDKQKSIRANNLPSDSRVYIKELEETLMSCFNQWKKMTAMLYNYLGKEQSQRVKGLDCIEWFCASTKARLEELRREGKYPELSGSIV